MTPSSTPSPFASGGRRIGPYELRAALGKGAQGGVFLGHDPVHDRPVAIKLLHAASGPALARFEREVEAIARLQHPGIVPLVDRGRLPDGRPYLVMAYTPGRPLAKLMGEGLPATDALRIVRDVARAVHHAHGLGVLHRDLKPENILVGDDGGARVLDFGLAQVQDLGRLTRSGAMLGTAAYMPPEQARGAAVDARADVFSLGATLYHALTGEAPMADDLPPALAPLHREVAPPSTLAEGLPAGVDAVVARAMAGDARDRHPTADAFADDLDRLLRGPVEAPRPARRRDRRGRRALLALALLALAVGVAAAAIAARRDEAVAVVTAPPPAPPAPPPPPPLPTPSPSPAPPTPELEPPSDEPGVAPAAPDPTVALSQGSPLRLVDVWGGFRARHLSMVSGVAVARRRGLVASTGIDGEVNLWDARDGSLLRRVVLDGPAWQVCFTADDAALLVFAHEGRVLTLDVATGQERRRLEGHHAGSGGLQRSPDGRRLVTSGEDGSLAVWRLDVDEDLPERRMLHRRPDGVGGCVAVWADDDRLVSIGEDGVVRVWSRDGQPLAALPVAEGRVAARRYWSSERAGPTGLRSVAARGDLVVVADVTGQVLLVDLAGSRVVWERRLVREGEGLVRHVSFTADGQRVVSSGDDGRIHVLSTTSGEEVAALEGHASWVSETVADARGRLYSCGNDGTVRRWDPAFTGWEQVWPRSGHRGGLTCLTWLPLPGGGGCVASAAAFDPRLRLSRPGGGEATVEEGLPAALAVVEDEGETRRLVAAIDTPDGTFLATWRIDRDARGLTLKDPDNVKLEAPVVALAAAAPRTFAIAFATGKLALVRRQGHALEWLAKAQAEVRAVAPVLDERGGLVTLALLRGAGDLAFFDAASGRLQDDRRGVLAHALATAPGRLAWASARGVTVQDVETDQPLGEVVDRAPPIAVALAPDGRWVACAYQDGRIALHEARGGGSLGAADLGPARDFAVLLHAASDGHLLAGTRRGAVLRFEVLPR